MTKDTRQTQIQNDKNDVDKEKDKDRKTSSDPSAFRSSIMLLGSHAWSGQLNQTPSSKTREDYTMQVSIRLHKTTAQH